jgi:hypothetical protein
MQLQYHLRDLPGHRIYASRKVAEKIEKQTRYAAELYNVDVSKISDIWLRKTFSLRRQRLVQVLA